MRPGSGARCPAPRKARLGSSRGWGVPPGPEPPSRAGVPSHCPWFLLGDPRGWHCPGSPWAVGVTCTPPRPPMAGKGLGINNGHCFPLMNVTGSCGLRPGERGASPASPRPGNPQPRPAGGACGCRAGPRLDTAAACHCLGCRWGPWAELGDGGAGGGGVPATPHLPLVLAQGLAPWEEGLVGAGRETPAAPRMLRAAQQSCKVPSDPVPVPQQCPWPGLGQGTAQGRCQP